MVQQCGGWVLLRCQLRPSRLPNTQACPCRLFLVIQALALCESSAPPQFRQSPRRPSQSSADPAWPAIAVSHDGGRIRCDYLSRGGFGGDNYDGFGLRSAVREWRRDNCAIDPLPTRAEVDYRDWPKLASGSIWQLHDREFRTSRSPPSAQRYQRRGTGTSNDQRSAQRSRLCARSILCA